MVVERAASQVVSSSAQADILRLAALQNASTGGELGRQAGRQLGLLGGLGVAREWERHASSAAPAALERLLLPPHSNSLEHLNACPALLFAFEALQGGMEATQAAFYAHTWQRGVGQRTSLSGSELGFGSLAVTRWAPARSSTVTEHRHASTAGHEVKPKTPRTSWNSPRTTST